MNTIQTLLGDRHPYSVQSDWTVRQVIDYLCERRIGAVVVCEDNEVVGVFSERDVLRRIVQPNLDPDTTQVSRVMTSNVLHVTSDVTHRDARLMMFEKGVRHLVVLGEQKQLLGFISMREVIEVDLEEQRELVHKLNDNYYQRAYMPEKK